MPSTINTLGLGLDLQIPPPPIQKKAYVDNDLEPFTNTPPPTPNE